MQAWNFWIQFNILLNNSDFLHPKPFLPVNRRYHESSNKSEQETTRCFRIQPWNQQAMETNNLCPSMVQQTLNVYVNCLRYLWCLENKIGNNKWMMVRQMASATQCCHTQQRTTTSTWTTRPSNTSKVTRCNQHGVMWWHQHHYMIQWQWCAIICHNCTSSRMTSTSFMSSSSRSTWSTLWTRRRMGQQVSFAGPIVQQCYSFTSCINYIALKSLNKLILSLLDLLQQCLICTIGQQAMLGRIISQSTSRRFSTTWTMTSTMLTTLFNNAWSMQAQQCWLIFQQIWSNRWSSTFTSLATVFPTMKTWPKIIFVDQQHILFLSFRECNKQCWNTGSLSNRWINNKFHQQGQDLQWLCLQWPQHPNKMWRKTSTSTNLWSTTGRQHVIWVVYSRGLKPTLSADCNRNKTTKPLQLDFNSWVNNDFRLTEVNSTWSLRQLLLPTVVDVKWIQQQSFLYRQCGTTRVPNWGAVLRFNRSSTLSSRPWALQQFEPTYKRCVDTTVCNFSRYIYIYYVWNCFKFVI